MDNDPQNWKELCLIDVTEIGIVISSNELQKLKVNGSIDVIDDGVSNVTFCNDEQKEKAFSPINVTDLGIVISIKDWQLLNA